LVVIFFQDGTPVGAISRVVTHPTLPLSITGHEDRHIRFFDNRSGKQTHSMVAHLDAVTSLAIDGHGLYLISGSKSMWKLMMLREQVNFWFLTQYPRFMLCVICAIEEWCCILTLGHHEKT
jgi:WD40 repeat protein